MRVHAQTISNMAKKSEPVGAKLVSGSVLRVAGLVASAIASFFLMPFVVRHLGDRLYGFWTLAAAFIGYYSLLDFGLSSAVSQYICIALGRNDHVECRSVFNTALRINMWLGGIALVATGVIAASTPLFCHSSSDARVFAQVIVILGINTAIGFPSRVFGGVLEAQLRFDIQSWLSILGVVLRSGLAVCVILAGGGLLGLAWVTLLPSLPIAALQVWFAMREAHWARLGAEKQTDRVRKLFSYSIYTFLSYLADILRFQVDPVVISGLIGLAAVTHYRVAGVFTQQYFLQVVVLAVGILNPVLSRLHGAGNRSRLEEVFFFGTKLSCCLSVFVCFGLIGWGKPFIARWMGMKYEDAYVPLIILALSVLLDVGQRTSIDLLYATFRHRFYTYMNWVEGAINLGFSLALARPLGVVGVAMGTLIGALIVRALVQPWWVCKVSGLHYGKYMLFLGKTMSCCVGLMGLAIAAAMWGIRPNYALLIASTVCAAAVYAAGSWLIILSPRERELILAAVLDRRRRKVPSTAAEAVLVQSGEL